MGHKRAQTWVAAMPLLIALLTGKSSSGALIVYVTSEYTNSVSRFVDGQRETLISGLGQAADIALDLDGNLFVADFDAGEIIKATISGDVSTFATGLDRPVGIAADSHGNVFVAENGTGLLKKVSPEGAVSTIATGLSLPVGLTLGPDGNIYVADSGSGNIIQATPAGMLSVYGAVPDRLYDLAFAPNGDLYAATNGNRSGIYRGVPGGTATYYSPGGFPTSGIAFDRLGNLFASNYFGGHVYKINLGLSPDIAASESFPTFLLTPDSLPPISPIAVPEPGAFTFAGWGAFGLLFGVWRKQRNHG